MRGGAQPRKPSVAPSQNVAPSATGSLPAIFDAPLVENPFFTGRTEIISKLRETLSKGERAALSGMPGVGKTETATEYAHRYRGEYKYVFWVNADTRDALLSGYASVASRLNLGLQGEPNQNKIANAVKQSLDTFSDWLFVLDNADDLAPIADLIPTSNTGHILITSRLRAFGSHATPTFLPELDEQEGATLLLRRARRLAKDAALSVANPEDREAALGLSRKMQGLPLPLDQAGAYIEDVGRTPAQYLDLYERRAADLLTKRGNNPTGHPASVDVTISLAFDKVAVACPPAAELLRACAFLASNAIPEEIFQQGDGLCPTLSSLSSDEIAFDDTLQSACHFSLIHRNPQDKTWNIHRLTQEVLKSHMNEAEKIVWSTHLVHSLNLAFPDPEFSLWEVCGKLLPHVLTSLEGRLVPLTLEGGSLSDNVAVYLYQRGMYVQAEVLATTSVMTRRELLGPVHTDLAESLNDLGAIKCELGRYEEAEHHLEEAIQIRESLFGIEHPSLMLLLNTMALVYAGQAKYQQAEGLHERVMRLISSLNSDYLDQVPATMNNLANLYNAQGRHTDAENLLQSEVSRTKKKFGEDHPISAKVVDNLGLVLQELGQYERALAYHKQALQSRLKVLQANHPDLAISYDNW